MDEKQTAKERKRQIRKLMESATAEQQQRIKAGQRAGRRLRKQVERL